MKKLFIITGILLTVQANAQWSVAHDFSNPSGMYPMTGLFDFHFFNDSSGINVNYYSTPPTMTGYTDQMIGVTNHYGYSWSNVNTVSGGEGAGIVPIHLKGFPGSDTIIRLNDWSFEWTVDQGLTWTPFCNTAGLALSFDFLNLQNCLFYRYYTTNILRRIHNGVVSDLPLIPGASDAYGISDIEMVTEARFFIIAHSNSWVLMSLDSGYTWTTSLDSNIRYNDITFVNDTIGYVCGDSGTVYKTINGGFSWDTLSTGTYEHLLNCSFIDPNTGLISGSNGAVLRTTDGGATWTNISIPGAGNLSKIQLLNNYAYCTDSKKLYRTNSALGIHEEKTETSCFSVYPNPAHDQFTIMNPRSKKIRTIRITNTMGQYEYSQAIENNSQQVHINLADLTRGIKLCTIEGEVNYTTKIIIE